MAGTRSTPDILERTDPTTPPSQVMETPTTPPGAPSKVKPAPPRTPPAQVTSTPQSPPGAPSGSPYTTRRQLFHNNAKQPFHHQQRAHSPNLSEITSFLTIPPFTAPQIQFMLWHLWTSTVSPTTIAKMHNLTFPNLTQMTRWTVIDIENYIATNWYARGRSFRGMEPWSLLVPPGDANEWSCVCEFGVENCWDYKRRIDGDGDGNGGEEDREKLCMAACLWDATPKQLVRCTHGRRKTEKQGEKKKEEEGRRKGELIPRPGAVTVPAPRAEWVLLVVVLVVAVLVAVLNGQFGDKAG